MNPMLTATKAGVRDSFLGVDSNVLETLLHRPVTPINVALNKLILSLKK
ncbi:hypothetical protein V7127_19575 [Bacillus sp. JJ1773]